MTQQFSQMGQHRQARVTATSNPAAPAPDSCLASSASSISLTLEALEAHRKRKAGFRERSPGIRGRAR
jgi:hypothetical protein